MGARSIIRPAGLAALLVAAAVGAGSLTGCGSAGTNTAAPTTANTGAPTTATSVATTPPSMVAPSTTSRAPSSIANPPVTVAVHVWFLNDQHAATGEEPLFEPVDRRVAPPALAGGALTAVFAGPTPAEQAAGLRLVTSGATGYTRLHIDNGVAYVTLEGGCASNGSTMTIAGEIMPTLKQFSSVTYVKIFAPDGTTETPTGASDSIPTCLEP